MLTSRHYNSVDTDTTVANRRDILLREPLEKFRGPDINASQIPRRRHMFRGDLSGRFLGRTPHTIDDTDLPRFNVGMCVSSSSTTIAA